eukprot:sb/3470541/
MNFDKFQSILPYLLKPEFRTVTLLNHSHQIRDSLSPHPRLYDQRHPGYMVTFKTLSTTQNHNPPPPPGYLTSTQTYRAVGNWTNRLYDVVKKRQDAEDEKLQYINGRNVTCMIEGGSMGSREKVNESQSHVGLTDYERESIVDVDWKDVEVFIDGPYGAPAVDIFETEHAVLIAAGIGYGVFLWLPYPRSSDKQLLQPVRIQI